MEIREYTTYNEEEILRQYARFEEGQANLTPDQVEMIRKILDSLT